MKKFLFSIVALLFATLSHGQPWMANFNGTKPVKLQDVINAWKNDPSNEETEGTNYGDGDEDLSYHFNRWLWYWQQHLDENGYIVSPLKTSQEWQKYKASHNLLNKLSRTTNATPAWQLQGPLTAFGADTGIGRITRVTFHPTDSNIFWVSTAGGGAWKTTDGGNTWSYIETGFPVMSVSDITVNPLNPNTIYMCTGDRDAGDSYSIGVLKSTDGGNTWDTTGLKWDVSNADLANNLLINYKDTNSLLLATNSGLYRSKDGGTTWNLTYTGNFTEIHYSLIDTTILFATGYHGTYGVQIYRSSDGGATWNAVTNITGANRISLALTPASPSMVKAISSNNSPNFGLEGIYSSSDTGKTFTRIYNADTSCKQDILSFDPDLHTSSCKGQGFYDLCIAISPIDTNSVYVAGINLWHNDSGGYANHWKIMSEWTPGPGFSALPGISIVHADKHFLGYSPYNSKALFECNDGGIYKTYLDAYDTSHYWTFLGKGLSITEFYRIAVSDNAGYVLGGAQDNGSKMIISSTLSTGTTGADGMVPMIDDNNPDIFYTSMQNGGLFRTTNRGLTYKKISDNIHPAQTGIWTTPFALDPQHTERIFAGYNDLYISRDTGNTWTKISGTSFFSFSHIAISPQNDSVIYIVASNTIWRSRDYAKTWTALNPPYIYSGIISDIAIDPNDTGHIIITHSGYTNKGVSEYWSSRYPATHGWNNLMGSLPQTPYNCVVTDATNGTIYVGNDISVFYRDTTMNDWAPYNTNFPTVRVSDLAINYTTSELWAGTYGRGIWKTTKHELTTGISVIPYAANVINVYPNPSKGHFTISTTNKELMNRETNVRIISSNGRIIWQQSNAFDNTGKMQISTDGLATGMYILETTTNNTAARTRIVIMN